MEPLVSKRVLMKNFKSAIRNLKIFVLEGLFRYFPGLVRAIVSRDAAGVNQVEIVQHVLSFSRDPILTLNFFVNQSGYPWPTLWVAINKIASEGEGVWSVLHNARSSISSRELRLCIEVKEYITSKSGEAINFSVLLDEYSSILKKTPVKPETIAGLLSTLVVTQAPIEDVKPMLDRLGLSLFSLTEFQQIKFLSRLADQGEREKFEWWESRRRNPLSDAGALKVSLLRANLSDSEDAIFAELDCRFMSLPFNLAERYRDEVRSLYDEVSQPRNLLAARFDAERKAWLRKMIIKAISEGNKLSYLRLGDGECYGLADQILVDERGEVRQEEHWWGEQLAVSLRRELQSRFRGAVAESTILGVPTVLRLIRDFNLSNHKDYPVNSLMARILCVMKGSAAYFSERVIVEDQSNLFLFDREFIDQIFREAEKVCVVSGVRADLIKQWAPDQSKLQCIEVPTHRLLREGAVGSSTEGILPYVYEHYVESIAALAGPKVVFLVSAGFIGKIFIAEAARNGSVALDVGQMLVSAVGQKRVKG